MNIPWILLADLMYYLRYYRRYAERRWDQMTPMEYGILLISVGVFGFILMKNASRR